MDKEDGLKVSYEDDCFGRFYDARIKYCKVCEIGISCRDKMIENRCRPVDIAEETKVENNPYRQNTSAYVCYEVLKTGGSFEQIVETSDKIIKEKRIKCLNVASRVQKVIDGCKSGFIHDGTEFVNDKILKFYQIKSKVEV